MSNSNDRTPGRGARFFALAAIVLLSVALDQWSKSYATSHWKDLTPQSFLDGMFQIRYAENGGAFLSLFANLPDQVRFWILTIGNAAMLAGLAIYLLMSPKMSWTIFWALSLLVGGGIGNLIDRVRFKFVVDFFYIDLGFVHTGVFNVADLAITAAFLIMLPVALWKESPRDTPEVSRADPSQSSKVLETAAEGPRP